MVGEAALERTCEDTEVSEMACLIRGPRGLSDQGPRPRISAARSDQKPRGESIRSVINRSPRTRESGSFISRLSGAAIRRRRRRRVSPSSNIKYFRKKFSKNKMNLIYLGIPWVSNASEGSLWRLWFLWVGAPVLPMGVKGVLSTRHIHHPRPPLMTI